MTVMIPVWGCLEEDQPNRLRGDVEQRRLWVLQKEYPKVCKQITRFAENVYMGQAGFCRQDERLTVDQMLLQEAQALIPTVIDNFSDDGIVDDRPIYWGRLFTQYFLNWNNRGVIPRDVRRELCSIYETTSRYYANEAAQDAPLQTPRVILTAFDPFLLNENIQQCNPSAIVALSLAEKYRDSVPIEVFVFPVRFRDFNKGIVERVLGPRFQRDPLFVLTLSMGRKRIELERFVGRRRSNLVLDNLDYTPVKKDKHPPCMTKAPEFLEFTLPAEQLVDIPGAWEIRDNRRVETRSRGKFEASSLAELEREKCVQASGGGFLSNEIAYRTRLLQLRMKKNFPLGHLHLPKVSKFEPETLRDMVSQSSRLVDRLLNCVG